MQAMHGYCALHAAAQVGLKCLSQHFNSNIIYTAYQIKEWSLRTSGNIAG